MKSPKIWIQIALTLQFHGLTYLFLMDKKFGKFPNEPQGTKISSILFLMVMPKNLTWFFVSFVRFLTFVIILFMLEHLVLDHLLILMLLFLLLLEIIFTDGSYFAFWDFLPSHAMKLSIGLRENQILAINFMCKRLRSEIVAVFCIQIQCYHLLIEVVVEQNWCCYHFPWFIFWTFPHSTFLKCSQRFWLLSIVILN